MISVEDLKFKEGEAFLGEIAFDEGLYPRKQVSTENVDRLVEVLQIGNEFHDRIIVEKATKQLLDGRHRFSAYKLFHGESWPEAKVLVRYVELPQEEFPLGWLMVAAKFNNDHGLPLTQAERRRNLARLKKEGVSEEAILEYATKIFSMSQSTAKTFLQLVDSPQGNGGEEKGVVGLDKGIRLAVQHVNRIKNQLAKGAELTAEDREKLEELLGLLQEILALEPVAA